VTEGGGGTFCGREVAWQPASPNTTAAVGHEKPKSRRSLMADFAAGSNGRVMGLVLQFEIEPWMDADAIHTISDVYQTSQRRGDSRRIP